MITLIYLSVSALQALHLKYIQHLFHNTHLLHWLEALGWIGKTSEGIQAILSLEAHVLVSSLFIIYKSLINFSLS